MGWARLDDKWWSHPKEVAAGLEASGLDARAISYCSDHETDGYVSDAALLLLTAGHRSPQRVAARLVDVGRWERVHGGYQVHDYLDYNPSHEDAEARREAERVRKASGRKAQGRGPDGRVVSTRIPSGSAAESARNPAGVPPVRTTTGPVPVPVPIEDPPSSPPPRKNRATPAPDTFDIDDGLRAWATRNVPSTMDIDRQTERFLDYHRAKGTYFKDWRAAWRTWMRRSADFGSRPNGQGPSDNLRTIARAIGQEPL